MTVAEAHEALRVRVISTPEQARARVDAIFTLRDDAADYGSPPEALRALGVDSADLRWLAVRNYLAELHDLHERALNRASILLIAAFLCNDNAEMRLGPGNGSGLRDMVDARERIRRYYGDKAAKVVNDFYIAPVHAAGEHGR